jgi:hypothetical protein
MKKAKYTFIIVLFSVGIISSQTTITNTPSTKYQTMKGWGVSVAWWGNLVGGMPQASIDDICNRVAVEVNLNFFRFNIGGGDNPNCPSGKHMRFDADMPGYRPFYANNQGFGVVDVSKDYRQIAVMDKLASLRAPYGDIITEMFSVSPPYYMTKSFCSAGAVGNGENLAPGFEDDFADYLCSVTKTLRDAHANWNIQDIEPFNEPYSNFWSAYGSQEGCKILASQQASVLYKVWEKQQTYGIENLSLVASDCNSISEGLQNSYDLWANHNNEYNGIASFAVHSYFGTSKEKADLYTNVTTNTGKPIWQSETGPLEWYLPPGGQWWWRHYDIAQRLIDDIRNLKCEVWCMWQAHGSDDAWALVQQTNFDINNPYKTPVLTNTKSFYIYQQIAKYAKVGYTQIANSDPSSITFLKPDTKEVVVVIANNTTSSKDYSVDLTQFETVSSFDTYRSSGDVITGENAKQLTISNQTNKGVLAGNKINYTAPAWSVTTFVVTIPGLLGSLSVSDFENDLKDNSTRDDLFTFYPNPSSDSVTVNLKSTENTKVQIVDINGQMVYESGKSLNKQTVINIKNILASGIYFIKVTAENKTQTQKLIVK